MTRSLGSRKTASQLPHERAAGSSHSELINWPVQLALISPVAPYLKDADILFVADCVPFACADFHQRFLKGRPVIIGCPKLDHVDAYVRKLTQIVHLAHPKTLTVVHMEVPCCSGLTRIAEYALTAAESDTPLQDVTVSIRGQVLASTEVAPRSR